MTGFWPAHPALPPGLPLGWITPPGTDMPPVSLAAWTAEMIAALQKKLQEAILGLVVMAVNGVFFVGEAALDQLAAWAVQLEQAADQFAAVLDGMGLANVGDFVQFMAHIPGDVIDGITATEQLIIDAIVNALGIGGTGHLPGDIVIALSAIPAPLIAGITVVEQLIMDAIANALGFLGSGHTPEDIQNYLTTQAGDVAQAAADISDIVLGAAAGTAAHLGEMVGAGFTNAANALQQFDDLLGGAGSASAAALGSVIGTAVNAIATLVAQIQALIDNVTGFAGGGFPLVFPVDFSGVAHTIEDVGAAILNAPLQAQQVLNTVVQTILGILPAGGTPASAGTDHSLDDLVNALQQLPLSPPLAAVAEGLDQAAETANQVGAIITETGVDTAEAVGAALASAGAAATSAVEQIDDVVGNVLQGAGAAVTGFGNAFGGFMAGLFNPWAATPVDWASANQAALAAQAAAAAAAAQAAQTAAINAQLPHFYGGSGTQGINVNVQITGSALPAGFTLRSTIATNSAVYSTTTAVTDQQTVSGIWSNLLPKNTARYLILRGNTGLTTYVYAKWALVGDAGYLTNNSGYFINVTDPSAAFTFEIGCVVAGVKTVFNTWSYPLWTFVVLASNGYYFYTANPGYSYYTNSANNVVALTATDYAFTLDYPLDPPTTYTDGSHVSQLGASYRSGGFGSDEPAFPGTAAAWSFYDSGPVAGPGSATVATSESTTSTSYADLTTTTDQVTVNIGSSGMALVGGSARINNLTTNQSSFVGYAVSGATTRAAADAQAAVYQAYAAGAANRIPFTRLETGLTAGATTFKMKYRVDGSTGQFSNREIWVIPL